MFKDLLSLFLGNKKAFAGILLLGFFLGIALLAPVLAPFDPKANRIETTIPISDQRDRMRTTERHRIDELTEVSTLTQVITTTYHRTVRRLPLQAKPSSDHWLGTTHSGQDIFSQLIWGTQVTLAVGLLTGLFTTILSLSLALVGGFLGGIVDDIISLFTNVFLVIPSLPLMIVIAAYISVRGMIPIILILGLTSWPWPTRVLRSQVISLKNRDFVKVSKSLGEKPVYIVFREILPNMISLVMASFFTSTMAAIIGATTLEFIGLGNPSVVSWGTMLYWAQVNSALLAGSWWWFLPPGICIALIGTSFALMNFAIDEISNPKLRKR